LSTWIKLKFTLYPSKGIKDAKQKQKKLNTYKFKVKARYSDPLLGLFGYNIPMFKT
jgi:hypothetical protein